MFGLFVFAEELELPLTARRRRGERIAQRLQPDNGLDPGVRGQRPLSRDLVPKLGFGGWEGDREAHDGCP